jgi:hypothetical protein
VLASRLEKFGLEVAAEKTNLMRFSASHWKASGTFEFSADARTYFGRRFRGKSADN